MPIRNAIWTVGDNPQSLAEARLPSERVLEDMIVAAPRILSDEWMLIGRQERTGNGGIVDLLAIAPGWGAGSDRIEARSHPARSGGSGPRLCLLGREA